MHALMISALGAAVFKKKHNYEQIQAGAHLGAAPTICPPALTWHMAFWKPLEIVTNDIEKIATDSANLRNTRKSEIDEYLYSI